MTVVDEKPTVSFHGNGTQTGYSFTFSYTQPDQIHIYYTPQGGTERQLGVQDFKLTPNVPPLAGATIEFLTITPQSADMIRVSRETVPDQKIDFIGSGTVTPEDVEADFDKVIRLIQEVDTEVDAILDTKLPDPSLAASGSILVADGSGKFGYFPLVLNTPTASDDNKVVFVDYPNHRFKYISSPGATNPAIPQPNAGSGFKVLGTQSGAYQLGVELPLSTALSNGDFLKWDGSKFLGVQAPGAQNPPITLPVAERQVLSSTNDGSGGYTTAWVDDSFKTVTPSTGVLEGMLVSKASANTVDVAAGRYQIVENTLDNPIISEYTFNGVSGVAVPTSTNFAHYIYLDVSGGTPTITVTNSYTAPARGDIIFLAEVEHAFNSEIENIYNKPTVLPALAAQFREFVVDEGNLLQDAELQPVSTTAGNAGASQLKSFDGVFIGYAANIESDFLKHFRVNLTAQSPVAFRWMQQSGEASAEATSIDFDAIQVENPVGTLTPLTANHFTKLAIWCDKFGNRVLQYPQFSVLQKTNLPTLDLFLSTTKFPDILLRNYALEAVLTLKDGTPFSTPADTFLTYIGGLSVTGGSTGATVPIGSAVDEGKGVRYDSNGNPTISPYVLPVPSLAEDGKSLLAENGSYVIGDPADILARTYMDNGILDGFKYTAVSTGDTLTISAGRAVFFPLGQPGVPTEIKVFDYPGGTYQITGIGTREISYIILDADGNLSDSDQPANSVRGNSVTLFRVEHYDNVNIEDVQPYYRVENALPEQVKEIWEAYGKRIKNVIVTTSGTNSLNLSGGVLYGFDAGAQVDELRPHTNLLVAQNPLNFRFMQTDGTETPITTTFPAPPNVELTPNTLTPLGSGNIAYYPAFIYSDGYTLIQYAKTEWAAGSEPALSDFEREYQFDNDILDAAWFLGWVVWERGKDFSNGNKFVLAGGTSVTSGGGGVPIIPATPQDATRLYTIDATGKTILGVKLSQPNPDGSDLADFSGKFLEYNATGDVVASTLVTDPNTGTAALGGGDHLVALRNSGNLEVLNKDTEYVDPSPWSVVDTGFYNVQPFYKPITRVGFLVSNMTRNDDPQGGKTHLRASEVFSGITPGGMTFNGKDFVNSVEFLYTEANFRKIFNELKPIPITDVGKVTPAAGQIRLSQPGTVFKLPTDLTPAFNFINNNPDPSQYPAFGLHGNSIGDSFLNSSLTTDIPLTLGGQCFYSPTSGGSAFFFPLVCVYFNVSDPQISVSLNIKSLQIKKSRQAYNAGYRIFAASDTSFQNPLFMNDALSVGTTNDTNIDINQSNIWSPQKSSYFLNPSGLQFSIPCVGFSAVPRFDDSRIAPDVGAVQTSITLNATLNFQKSSSDHARYEIGSLQSLNNLTENGTTIWTNGNANLAAGKILLFYHLLLPKVPQNLAAYEPTYEGIVLHPYILKDLPSIFLEEQTGTTPPTNRVEFKRRKGRSVLEEVFEIDCTPEQFQNWKLVMYFRNTLTDQGFKTLSNNVGASIWLCNSSDFPA